MVSKQVDSCKIVENKFDNILSDWSVQKSIARELMVDWKRIRNQSFGRANFNGKYLKEKMIEKFPDIPQKLSTEAYNVHLENGIPIKTIYSTYDRKWENRMTGFLVELLLERLFARFNTILLKKTSNSMDINRRVDYENHYKGFLSYIQAKSDGSINFDFSEERKKQEALQAPVLYLFVSKIPEGGARKIIAKYENEKIFECYVRGFANNEMSRNEDAAILENNIINWLETKFIQRE